MSMKRTKQAARGSRSRDAESSPFTLSAPKPVEEPKSWDESVAGQPDDAFVPYSLKASFEKDALIQHPTFGKGLVTAVEGKRIVVLFEDGTKKLGHAG